MIDAAERLIVERGIPALTLRDVQLAANQPNKFAAKYHFGSREGLIEALVEARMGPVNARCREMLDSIERAGAPLTVRQAVTALVLPLAAETLGRPGSYYARFLVQAVLDPALADLVQKHLMAESYRRVHHHLMDLCPAPGEVAGWRTNNTVMFSITALATREGPERAAGEAAAIVSDLIGTLVVMLEAPVFTDAPEFL